MRSFAKQTTILALLICSVGCAPAVLLPPPADLPLQRQGRHLYHTPNAYIYAHDSAAAGEADQIVANAAAFLKSRGGTATKGLVFVTSTADVPLTNDARAFQRLLDQTAAADDSAYSSPWTVHRHDLGFSPEEAWGMGHFVIPPAALPMLLGKPGIPHDRVPWIVALPTRWASDTASFRLFMRLCTDVPSPESILLAPVAVSFITVMAPFTQASILYERDVAIFSELARCESKWTRSQASTHAAAFLDEPMRKLGLPGFRVYWP